MKNLFHIVLGILFICSSGLRAQVTIGDNVPPYDFSILELISGKSATGGLRMPQLTENEIIKLTASPEFQAEQSNKALGLTVFNTTTNCIEYWDGTQWIERCDEECCTAPASPCPMSFNYSGAHSPLWLNDEFIVAVAAVSGISYTWTVPPSMSIVETNGDWIRVRATTPGKQLLSNIGVTATNACGSTSAVCTGSGEITVLDCDRAPDVSSNVNAANIKVKYADSGAGTLANPYVVTVGNSIEIVYENPASSVNYEWFLDAEGQNYFEVLSSSRGVIILRAKDNNTNGAPCGANAIRLRLSNNCGSTDYLSGIRVKIIADETCDVPAAPGAITFSKTTMLAGDIFTASIASVPGATNYSWMLSYGLSLGVEVIGGATTNVITLRAKTAGTYERSGLSVIANNNCGPSNRTDGGSGFLIINNPSSLPEGTGTFRGKTCFDVAKNNNNTNGCGAISGRYSQRTDFTLRTPQDPTAGSVSVPYTGVQVYTFKPSSTVSNVRFSIEDVNGAVISYMPNADYSATVTAGKECKLTVYFDPNLNTRLLGLTRNQAWKVYISAIYTEGGVDKVVKLALSLQDCACCGAKVSNGGWLNFMCHNLGADESRDPFNYHSNLKGDLYQWGRTNDGHQKRTSPNAAGPVTTLDANGQVAGAKKGYFIVWGSSCYVMGGDYTNWRYPKDDNLWMDSQKTVNDPCPPGWKVPSYEQWQDVLNNNTWTWTGWGRKVGDALYLPAAGSRSPRYGNVASTPESGCPPFGLYWSSTPTNMADPHTKGIGAYALSFHAYGVYVSPTISAPYRSEGRAVRCVEE